MGDLGEGMIREAKKGSNELTKQLAKEKRKQGTRERIGKSDGQFR